MSRKKNYPDRQRCLAVGCNPLLRDQGDASKHSVETGHRTAKWPVRSAEGKRRARIRNQTGYYDKYNVGSKSAVARGISGGGSSHPFTTSDLPLSPADIDDNGAGDGESYWVREERLRLEFIEENGWDPDEDWLATEYHEYRSDHGGL